MGDFTEDRLLGGRILLRQPKQGYRVAVDPVLLAAFVPAKTGESICELGCGTAAALLCMSARVDGLQLTGLEPNDELRALAKLNAPAATIIEGAVGGDWVLPERAFDHVIFNPPFYPAQGYAPSPAETRTAAHGLQQGLSDWIHAARRALKPDGHIGLIIHADQLDEALAGLAKGFGATEILPVRPKAGANAIRLLIRAQMGRKTPTALLPGLVLHEADGSYTQAAQKVLAGAESL